MRTACWNCQGLGVDLTVRRLKEINRKYLPDILCLSETKQEDNYIRDVGCELGFINYVTVPPLGLSGGLVVFWKQSVDLSIYFRSPNLVDCLVKCNEISFYLSFVYGNPKPSLRNHLWERIERTATTRRGPWLIMGDFNELLNNEEKRGGRRRPDVSFHDFRQMVRSCDFTDLKSIGDRFSWFGQRGKHQVFCCLDRTMANTEWHLKFPSSETEFLEFGESDHRPLVSHISESREERRGLFRYDRRLTHKEGFKESVLQGWNNESTTHEDNPPLTQRLTHCRKAISKWKKENRVNAEERISIIRYKLNKAVTSGSSSPAQRDKLKKELNQAYIDEEIFWKTKSINMWLKEGDHNTKFFHSITKMRRAKNKIQSILDENGVLRRGDVEIGEAAENYFKELFRSSTMSENNFGGLFNGFQKKVTEEINRDLIKEVSHDEIRDAIFSIGAHRAPGPDGFTGEFYQQFWHDINPAIISEVRGFFERGRLDPIHNHTNICLIPKVTSPSSMVDFRPIALCNVSYKIISKILVNRLKKHLSGIVTENQAAFIPGRSITDNIIIAHEVFHALKVRKRQAKAYMALKTDITKAYDRLEWSFLEETMKQMGFDQRWIQWIMECVSTVSFSVLINGSPRGFIKPERGIRQGDPLSPYLFILCAEVLSQRMNIAMTEREIQGIKIGNYSPAVNHLLFADDSLFFTLANTRSCKSIKNVLSTYEAASGQAVNLCKSSITFGSKVKQTTKRRMRHILGIHNEGGNGKYLGIPEQFGRKKTEMFQYIIDKVKERTQGWSKRFLSHGGKEILLKSAALAMPIYSMNVFKLPKEICEEINGLLAKFWWSSGEERKGMHWFAWN